MTGENRDRVGELDGRIKSLEQYNLRLSTALEKSEAREVVLVDLCSTLIGAIQENPGMVSPAKRKAIEASIPGLGSARKHLAFASDPEASVNPHAVPVTNSESIVRMVESTMAWNDTTNADTKVAASAANAEVKDIIYEGYVSGHFFKQPDPMCLVDVPCPTHLLRENAKFNYSVKVMVLGFDRDGWAVVNGDYRTKEAKEKAETVITTASEKALEAMLRLEYNAGMKDPSNHKKGRRAPSATVTALGERYRLWEKKVGLNANSLYDAQLEESGYKSQSKQSSVWSYFTPKPKPVSTVTQLEGSAQGVINPYSKGK